MGSSYAAGSVGLDHRLSFRATVVGEQALLAEVNSARVDVCSTTSTYHAANGRCDTCGVKRDDGTRDE